MRLLENYARKNWTKPKGTIHFAALSINGKLIGFTQNCGLSTRIFGQQVPTRHAEIRALLLIPNDKQKKRSIYVCRISKETNQFTESKPCKHCLEKMKEFSVDKVFYTNQKGSWIMSKIDRIENCHISLGYRLKNLADKNNENTSLVRLTSRVFKTRTI